VNFTIYGDHIIFTGNFLAVAFSLILSAAIAEVLS